jgi:uncharacterized protein YcfJ
MRNPGRIVILSLAAAAVAGCTNMDSTPNRTATGGLIGAGTGALIGNLLDDGTGAVVGGALGSLAGAAIGANLDRQHLSVTGDLSGFRSR